MFIRLAKLLSVAGLILAFAAPLPAAAATDPFKNVDCGKARDSTVCQTKAQPGDPITGPDGVITTVTNILATIAGTAAVIFIILGGLKYVSANGDAAEVSKAKQTIIYAITGLVLIVLARSIIGFVINEV